MVRIAIQTDVDYAKKIGRVLDSGLKLGCDVPSTNPPIHLWLEIPHVLRVLSRHNVFPPRWQKPVCTKLFLSIHMDRSAFHPS